MSEEITGKTNEKKPPIHEVLMAILAGEHDDALKNLDLLDWETAAAYAYLISKSHIPEKARLDLTATLIDDIKDYPFDGICLIHEAYALAILSMGTEDAVENVLVNEEETLESNELKNLQALMEAIVRLSEESSEPETSGEE